MAHVKFEAKKVDGGWVVDMSANDSEIGELATLFGKILAQAVVDFSENPAEFSELSRDMMGGFFSGISSTGESQQPSNL